MKKIIQALQEAQANQEETVLVTIISNSGSTPGKVGARMLIDKNGRKAGTIGGGAVEYQSEELAKQLLQTKSSLVKTYILAPNEMADLGMICGGNAEVLFQYFSGNDAGLNKICEEILAHIQSNEPYWLLQKITEEQAVIAFYSEQSGMLGAEEQVFQPLKKGRRIVKLGEQNYYSESFVQTGKVYVFGGGHVSQAVVPVLKTLDFYVVVADDRPDFLTKELFPTADERLLVDLAEIDKEIQLNERDYAVIMTRGHKFDYELEKQALLSPAKYIGVMGSKHKVATHIKKLQEDGFAKAEIERISMPIGLKIKAETPAELAISVAGELIKKRAGS